MKNPLESRLVPLLAISLVVAACEKRHEPTASQPATPAEALQNTRERSERGADPAAANARKASNQRPAAAQAPDVPKDPAAAFEWYRQAAAQGDAAAQFNLGLCYEHGQGVAKDEAAAAGWYRKAAEQGHAGAQCSLGVCYFVGVGVENDPSAAVGWYRKAAEQGNVDAQLRLGVCYASGREVPEDLVNAYLWVDLAVTSGHQAADSYRAFLAKKMTPAQIAEAQRLARAWKPAPGAAP